MLDGFQTHAGSGLRISLPVAGGGGGGGGGNISFGIRLGERETAGSSISFVKSKIILSASSLKNDVSSWKTTSSDFTGRFVDGL